MFPIGLYALGRIIQIEKTKVKIRASIKTLFLVSFVFIIIPIGFFLWFNKMSYNNPLQFSGTVGGVDAIDANGLPTIPETADPEHIAQFLDPDSQEKSATTWFQSRNLLNGLYIHTISPDRGFVTYAPVLILAIMGIYILYKSENKYLTLFLGIIGANLIFYSMWGDPWGGWAFGSRYMIPSYAILAILLSVALSKFHRKWFFIIPFWLLLMASIGINTLGALTTSAIPPKVESLALEKVSGKQERYSYDRNWEFLNITGSKSFVYQTYAYNYLAPVQYFYVIFGSIAFVSTFLALGLILNKNDYS